MKTKALLNKYRKIIAGLIQEDYDTIKFYIKKSDAWYEILDSDIQHIKTINWCQGQYKVTIEAKSYKHELASFELYEMPHCCAFLISCRSSVNEKFRNRRIGTVLNNLRQDIGRLLGYSTLLCTDIEQNKHQRQLLATNGWKDIYDVKNKRTGNRVYISVINL